MYHSCIGKIFCVLETGIQLFGKNKQNYIFIKRTLPHGGGNILFQACFSASGPGQLGTIEGKMNSQAKNVFIL